MGIPWSGECVLQTTQTFGLVVNHIGCWPLVMIGRLERSPVGCRSRLDCANEDWSMARMPDSVTSCRPLRSTGWSRNPWPRTQRRGSTTHTMLSATKAKFSYQARLFWRQGRSTKQVCFTRQKFFTEAMLFDQASFYSIRRVFSRRVFYQIT